MARCALERYFLPADGAPHGPYRRPPLLSLDPDPARIGLILLATFAEIWLAKRGHAGLVGINLLEKIQLPTLPALYGSMLAGVDYVLMGAGIPREIPGALDRLAQHQPASLRLAAEGLAPGEAVSVEFDPRRYVAPAAPLTRPQFLPVVSSATLAMNLARKSSGRVDGFVVEHHTAGGHNAPPRGLLKLTGGGEPVYGPRDEADLAAMREVGLPFWLGGSYGSPERLAEAIRVGAHGIQVGTLFAFCEESGFTADVKRRVLEMVRRGTARVYTSARFSPTGFPFKVIQLPGSLSDPEVFAARPRVCDLGYLRIAFKQAGGGVGFRCPAEPEASFLAKGGAAEESEGRRCLCNNLLAAIGLAQTQSGGYVEPALITSGDDLASVRRLLETVGGRETYCAADVLRFLSAGPPASPPPPA
jgi:nitronate monooxygenase